MLTPCRLSWMMVFLLVILSGVSAGGNKEVPVIPPLTSGVQYISPNGDGIKDEASLTFTVKIFVKSDSGYIPEYGFQILAPSGEVVAQETTTEKQDIGWFASIFRGYEQFDLEKTITWDGRNDAGNTVDDGPYAVNIWCKDSSGNETWINVDDFVVDTKAPSVIPGLPESLLFSPNGDGVADEFSLSLREGTEEDLWTLEFLNSGGAVVRALTWKESAPANFSWDGGGDDNSQAADGSYSLRLASEDRGGNSFSWKAEGIRLDSRTPMIHRTVENSFFSPNEDGILDEAVISFEYDDSEAQSWSWSLSRGGVVVRNVTGEGTPPGKIAVDGRDDLGESLPQGGYIFAYSVSYENGWRPVIQENLELDVTPPIIGISVSSPIFSPNGDGLNDKTSVTFKSNEKVTWRGSLLDKDGQPMAETGSDQTTSLFVWDGTDLQGNPAADGDYLVLGAFTDQAGNLTYGEPATLSVDNRSVGITLTAPSGFSPNGDGFHDTLYLDVEADLYEEVERWTLSFLNEDNEVMRTFSDTDELPRTLAWDGSREDSQSAGVPISDGLYSARLVVRYRKGDVVEAFTEEPFYADVVPPEIELQITSNPFEKTEEGIEGEMFMSLLVNNESTITNWSLNLYDNKGNVLRSYDGEGNPSGDIAWNSRNAGLAEGMEDVTVVLEVADAGGNVASLKREVPLDILVIRREGKLFLMVPNIIFGAYQHGISSAGPSMEARNMNSLKQVADIYQRYPHYRLGLEAHALNIYRNGPREEQEEDILGPLTERRAQTVRDALVNMGIPPRSIITKAYGGRFPLTDVTDRGTRWKNRRVEFLMVETPPQ